MRSLRRISDAANLQAGAKAAAVLAEANKARRIALENFIVAYFLVSSSEIMTA